MRRLGIVLLLAGCATLFGSSAVRWVEAPSGKRAAPALPRRDDCLKPPFTLPPDTALTLHGFKAEPRGDGPRELTLTSAAGAPLEPDVLLDLLKRDDAALKAIDGVERVGLSGCPGVGGRPVPCVTLSVEICAQRLDRLAEALAELAAKDAQLRGHQLVFHVALVGAVGPRCEADDPRCRPEPYEGAQYQPGARRGLLKLPADDEGAECHSDGECAKSSCGGDCVPWTTAHQAGACTADPKLREALCGCVDQRCAWFVQ